MSKISRVLVSAVSRRWYGVQARAVNVHMAAAAGRTDGMGAAVADGGRGIMTRKKEVFWMRDPKTGCWVPENRFDEVDAVELRNRLLHCK